MRRLCIAPDMLNKSLLLFWIHKSKGKGFFYTSRRHLCPKVGRPTCHWVGARPAVISTAKSLWAAMFALRPGVTQFGRSKNRNRGLSANRPIKGRLRHKAAGRPTSAQRSLWDICVISDKLWCCQRSRANPPPFTNTGHLIIRLAVALENRFPGGIQKCK